MFVKYEQAIVYIVLNLAIFIVHNLAIFIVHSTVSLKHLTCRYLPYSLYITSTQCS